MIRCGFAQVDITPGPTTQPTGSYRPRVMNGAHDPLLAAACVIGYGQTPIALVGIDCGVIMRSTAEVAMRLIEQRTGIPPANVIISASHTHAGGPTLSVFKAVADPEYARQVASAIADAVEHAWEKRADSEIGGGFGRVEGIHFNRRFLMREGRQVTHPGKLNRDIVRPAGPVDEKVGVLAARNRHGQITGIIVNFGCHCTVTEDAGQYSADYVHFIRQALRQAYGDIEVVFLLGACGDVTQVDNQSDNAERGFAHAEKMGRAIATQAAHAIEQSTWSSAAECRVAGMTVPIAVRDREYSDPPAIGLGSGDFWEPIFHAERERVAQFRAAHPTVDCHITAARIGDLAIVTSGGELFCGPSLDIQSASPIARTWVTTLSNEYIGYIPTADAHYAGGYEPRLARSSFLAPDAAQKIVIASLAALSRIA